MNVSVFLGPRPARMCAVVCALAVTTEATAEITPAAERVLARHLEAVGGAEAVRAIHTTHLKAKLEAFGLVGSTEVWSQSPDRSMTRTEIGPFKLADGYDGAVAWRTDPTGKFSILDGKDLEEAKSAAYFENDLWLMADQGGGSVSVVKDSAAGSGYVVLEVVPPVGRTRRYWINTTTNLIDKSTTQRDQQKIVNTYADYRQVMSAGKARRVAFVQTTEIVGMPANTVKVAVETIELNVAVDESLFAPPRPPTDVVKYLKTPGVATLPFTYLARHVWLKASVNGGLPADFIYDTGASLTVIDSAYAAKIGLEAQGALHAQGAGSAGSASLSSLRTLRVDGDGGDGVEMKDSRVAILSINAMLAPFFWRDCAGIIGYDFITQFVNEIDFDRKTLTLRDPKTFHYDGKGTAIPMTLAGTVPVVPMKIDGQYDGQFRIDVGSSSTVDVHTPYVAKHGLREKAHPAIDVIGGGFGGTFTNTLTRMKKVEIGPYSWTEPLISLASTTSGALASEDYAGNLGNHILERFKCTFDYDHKTLYVEPGAKYASRDHFTRAGIQLARYGDTVKAMQVIQGSPAARAGLRENDVVTAIGGKPVLSWTLEGLRELFEDGTVGAKVKIEIEREGKRKKLSVKLEEML